jgi:uncharacterized protein YhfF
MENLNQPEKIYWEKYLSALPEVERPKNPHVTASFAGNREITDELLALYLNGKKCAGSSIVEDFLTAGDPLPKVGNYWIFLNSKDEPSCILRTEKITIYKFKDIPIEIVLAEGEGDLSIAYWRRVHTELYLPFLAQWGVENIEDATVITEFFKIVYK